MNNSTNTPNSPVLLPAEIPADIFGYVDRVFFPKALHSPDLGGGELVVKNAIALAVMLCIEMIKDECKADILRAALLLQYSPDIFSDYLDTAFRDDLGCYCDSDYPCDDTDCPYMQDDFCMCDGDPCDECECGCPECDEYDDCDKTECDRGCGDCSCEGCEGHVSPSREMTDRGRLIAQMLGLYLSAGVHSPELIDSAVSVMLRAYSYYSACGDSSFSPL